MDSVEDESRSDPAELVKAARRAAREQQLAALWASKAAQPAGPAVVAAAGIAIVPASPVEAAPSAKLPPPSIWSMPLDALPDAVERSPYETAAAILERLHSIGPILTGALPCSRTATRGS